MDPVYSSYTPDITPLILAAHKACRAHNNNTITGANMGGGGDSHKYIIVFRNIIVAFCKNTSVYITYEKRNII